MKYASVLTLLLWATPVWADPPVAKLSGPAAVKVGDPIILNPTGSVAPGGLEFGVAIGPGPVPIVTLKSDDGKTVIGFGTAGTQGAYTLYVVTWGVPIPNGKPEHAFAFWPVTVGDVLPTPPPSPVPSPVDPLTTVLQAAYATDVSPDKVASLDFLKSAYRAMAANPKSGLATGSQALAWMQSVVQAPGVGLTPDKLANVRKAIADHLLVTMGPSTAPVGLDAVKFKAELTTISNALAGVK